MAKYFAGTRTLLWNRTAASVVLQSTVGSPARFDAALVGSCIQLPAGLAGSPNNQPAEGVVIPVGMDATSASDLYLIFDWLGSSSQSSGFTARQAWIEFLAATGAVIARLSFDSNSNALGRFDWGDAAGTSFTQAGSQVIPIPSTAGISTFQLRFRAGASGTNRFQFWQNGGLVMDISNIPLAITANVAAVRIRNCFQGLSYLSQVAMSDFDMRGYRFPTDVISATGSFNDGTGTPAQTADGDFTTAKSLPASGNVYSGTHGARTLPGNLAIESVTIGAIIRAGGSVPQARSVIVAGGVAYPAPANISPSPSTGYEWRGQDWPNHPALGPWTQANYNAAEKGHEARAA
jgi:hypothetical protein